MRTTFLCIALFVVFLATTAWSQQTTTYTLQSTQTAVSPLTGLVLWDDSPAKTTYKDSIALQFSYFGYNQVVTDYNPTTKVATYNWSAVDQVLSTFQNNNHAAVIRFRDQDPSEDPGPVGTDGKQYIETFLPTALKQLPAAQYQETAVGWMEGDDEEATPSTTIFYKFPDWSSTHLVNFYTTFFTDLAARYDGDVRLAYLQFGFGNYGEYHIHPYTYNMGVNFPSKATQNQLLTLLASVFTQTPFLVSIDAASTSRTDLVNNATISSLPFGLLDDSFMHQNHQQYNEPSFNSLNNLTSGQKRWETGPIGGEISYYTEDDQKNFLAPGGMYGRTWPQQAKKFHVTFMLANDAPSTSWNPTPNDAAAIKAGSLAAGYKLAITNVMVTPNAAATHAVVVVTVNNTGVAALYHNFFLKINNNTSTTSLRHLAPGEAVNITMNNIDITQVTPTTPLVFSFTSPKVYTTTPIPYTANNVVYSITTQSNSTNGGDNGGGDNSGGDNSGGDNSGGDNSGGDNGGGEPEKPNSASFTTLCGLVMTILAAILCVLF